MGVENIASDILEEARQAAEISVKNAEKSKDEIICMARIEAEKIKNDAAADAVKNAENIRSRHISSGELQARKMILGAKQEAIKRSFDAALERLISMPEDKYIDFLASEIIKIPYNGGTIVLNVRDRDRIGEKLVKIVNERLKTEKFKLGDEAVNAAGGFVLKSGSIIINSTFETILNSVRDNLTNEIANILFE